jgi:hypothetical protein
MNEFNNRIAAQRQLIHKVNRKRWEKEELFGLSSKAIERWVFVNGIDPDSRLVELVRAASSKLFFLANKSQEQISDEYKMLSNEIAEISREIEIEMG